MALTIRTTGLADFLDGSANIKMMIVGGPDSGKTRSASYWPRPFYLDCENSRGSLRDRAMPYVEIATSADMLDALEYLKKLESTPKTDRQFQTVVVDTLDSFQRKVKDEWLRDTNAGVFAGHGAWGYLDAKMQMLLARLLNLDYNVICNVHWVRERPTDDDGPRQYGLQLDGKISQQVFNDFALVGRIGTHWVHDASTGQKVERRGLTFKKDTEWPFLKDRFGLFSARWMPIVFADEDYNQISRAFAESADEVDMPESTEVGHIPTAEVTYTRNVVAPTGGGPVQHRKSPTARTLSDLSKSELLDRARKLPITVKANWVKAELIDAIEAAEAQQEAKKQARAARQESDAASASPASAQVEPEPPSATVHQLPAPQETDQEAQAVQLVQTELGGTVVDEREPEPAPEPAVEVRSIGGRSVESCDRCGKSLADEQYSFVQLGWFKLRELVCNACYQTAIKTAQ